MFQSIEKTPDGQYNLNIIKWTRIGQNLLHQNQVLSSATAEQVITFTEKRSQLRKTFQMHWLVTDNKKRICTKLIERPHLPGALVVLLLESNGPVIKACVRAVVHAEDNRPAQDHPWRATTHHGTKQRLAAGQR